MAISITVRADDVVIVYDEDDPRSGVVIKTIAQAEGLITGLNATVAYLREQQAQMEIRMRAVSEAAADDNIRLN